MPNQPSVLPINQQSAADFIASGLRLVGAIGSGDPIPASELNDAQMILNQMLDAWTAESVMIFSMARVTVDQNNNPLVLVPGQQAYTLGNSLGSENFFMPRPPRLERVSVMYSASQSTPVEVPLDMLDEVEWQGIANKTTQAILPQTCHDDLNYPVRTLFFWPIPTQANPLAIYPWQALNQFTDLTTKMAFPPAYAEAIRFNLAERLGVEFPGDPNKMPMVIKMARQSKNRIASFNAQTKVAWCDEAILGSRPRGNIYTGSPTRSRNF